MFVYIYIFFILVIYIPLSPPFCLQTFFSLFRELPSFLIIYSLKIIFFTFDCLYSPDHVFCSCFISLNTYLFFMHIFFIHLCLFLIYFPGHFLFYCIFISTCLYVHHFFFYSYIIIIQSTIYFSFFFIRLPIFFATDIFLSFIAFIYLSIYLILSYVLPSFTTG